MFRKILSSVLLISSLIIGLSPTIKADSTVSDGGDDHEAGPAPAPTKKACPDDMVEIDGQFCPNTEDDCLYWVDPEGSKTHAPLPGHTGRCGEFKSPNKCLSTTVRKHFCIDRYEFPNHKGGIPQSWMSWYDSKRELEAIGKRLCTNSEWTMAAEGPGMHPIPYGNGYKRDKSMCNFDNSEAGIDVFKATSPKTATAELLQSMLVPSGSKPECVSDYGVYDMAGNIDEFVVNESGKPYVSGMKGGHIFGVRNASRPMTEVHGPTFAWYESGTRGCKDAE